MENIKIYKLIDPISKEVRYVGKTKGKLSKRLSEHLSRAKNNTYLHVYCWIRLVLKNNLIPTIELIEDCIDTNWEEREKYWISYYPNLTNISNGGITYLGQYQRKIDFVSSSIKKVIKYDLDGNFLCIYPSITEASEGKDSVRKHISCCCNMKRKSTNGFQWRYYTENYEIKINKHTKEIKNMFIKGHILNKGKKLSDKHKQNISLGHIRKTYRKHNEIININESNI